ncbi:MAG: MATE family efflux transporter [Spirochaetaceae bacterium]|nr:MATE family efflux transporter [Spirochaetaceae bacterium]
MTKGIFSDRDFFSKLLHITLPLAFQNLMLASVAAADAMMLGFLNQNSMSAVSLATQIQFIQNMFIFSVVSVESILGAQYWGKNDKETVSKVFCLSIKLSVAVSFLFFAGCEFFPRQLMLIFTNEEELISLGIEYLKIAGWSYLLTGISQCYLTLMKISNHPGRTAFISSACVVINIILNAVFIFGFFGLPTMDVRGAALATLIARAVELAWCVLISYRKDYIHLNFKHLFSYSRLLFVDFMKCLYPLIGAGLFWGIGFTSYTAFMGHLGTDAAAANSVAAVVRDLLCCLCNGICNAAGIIVGNELGAGNLKKGKLYGERIYKLSLLCGLLITLLTFATTPILTRLVKLTEDANVYLVQMMIILSIYMFGRTVNTIVINGIFASGGDTLFDMYSLAVCMWGIAVPLAALGAFVFHWPIYLVYACTCVDEVGKIPWVIHHYKKYKWLKDLTRE